MLISRMYSVDGYSARHAVHHIFVKDMIWCATGSCGANLPVSIVTTSVFAYHNQSQPLRWCIRNGVPHSDSFCISVAARGGNLEVLQLLKANKYAWRAEVEREAKKRGYYHILRWLGVRTPYRETSRIKHLGF